MAASRRERTIMHIADTQQARLDTSLATMDACLRLVKQASSDNDTFSALLSITNHVRSKTFTAEDQRTILEAVGLEFISRLVNSQYVPPDCPPDYYKCIGLSILSAWTVERFIVLHPAMTDFLAVINQVISPASPFKVRSHSDSHAIYEQLCRDCEEIVFNLTKHEAALDRLLQSGTFELLLEYSRSPSCQNVLLVLESLSTVVRSKGEGCLNLDSIKLLDVIKSTVTRLEQDSDVRGKAQCARILTSFLAGLSTVEVTVQMDWVRKLVLTLRTLISAKLAPDDSQDVLGLVCALVNTAGPQVLGLEASGDDHFLRAVVARVSVEIYMQLDCIHVHNAGERYPVLDRVYKLLSSVIQFLAESGEGLDADSIIIIYRKLVDISQTLMEFLFSVAHQEIQFPKKHDVVLVSVRALAAMLAEITEDVTPRLLELLPFFNLLCQNVEHSEDVVMELQDTEATARSDKSIEEDVHPKLCNAAECVDLRLPPELSSEHHQMDTSSGEFHRVSSSTSENINHVDQSSNSTDRSGRLNAADPQPCEADSSSFKTPSSSSLTGANHVHTDRQQCGPEILNTNNCGGDNRDLMLHNNHISISQTNIDNFKAFQASVYSLQTRAESASSRKVTFVEKEKVVVSDQAVLGQWTPMPGDVLGSLMPAYMCLLDNQEVVEVMSRAGAFQTIVTFLDTSLSHLLENHSSGYPESTTINALSVIELVYTNSPVSAASLDCFQKWFETSLLSLPNLLAQPHPPPLVCLKLLEVTLAAYRIQMRDENRKPSLPQFKQSQSQLFKAAVDYLSAFYEIRQHRGKQLSLHIRKEFRDVWPLAQESWSGCIAGLCTLVRSVEELQDSLAESPMFPHFLSFLVSSDDLPESSDAVHELVESMFSLIESAAEGSVVLCELIRRNHGHLIANKFHLKKLDRCLQTLLQ